MNEGKGALAMLKKILAQWDLLLADIAIVVAGAIILFM